MNNFEGRYFKTLTLTRVLDFNPTESFEPSVGLGWRASLCPF